jgi:peroxiredoxin
MKSIFAATVFASALALTASSAFAATVGQAAPAFSITDTSGKTVNLADFKGKTVVLEWTNPDCPFVQKHYSSANMQGTQKDASAKGVVWLTVNSTTREHQDYKAPAAMAQWMQAQKAAASATLMDPDGKVGKAYGARTTPHMYVVDAAGTLVYAGGIDNKPSANPADVAGATNHVKAALAEVTAGKAVTTASTKPYGCSIKYSNGA